MVCTLYCYENDFKALTELNKSWILKPAHYLHITDICHIIMLYS